MDVGRMRTTHRGVEGVGPPGVHTQILCAVEMCGMCTLSEAGEHLPTDPHPREKDDHKKMMRGDKQESTPISHPPIPLPFPSFSLTRIVHPLHVRAKACLPPQVHSRMHAQSRGFG